MTVHRTQLFRLPTSSPAWPRGPVVGDGEISTGSAGLMVLILIAVAVMWADRELKSRGA
jgi:hypothetical protein